METGKLGQIHHLLADMDGVIYRGDQALPGAVDFLHWLEQQGIGLLYITNNSTRTPQQYVQKLAGMGIPARPEQILTSSLATRAYLEQQAPRGTRVYLIGEHGLQQAMLGDGYFQLDEGRPAYVVVGLDHQVNYDKLRRATLAIRAGAGFIGSNPDRTFPSPEGIVPGAGTILAALEAATDVRPAIIGKPERWMIAEAMQRLGADPQHTAVLGDRLETDILGGKRLGLTTLMVLTGVHGREDIAASEIKPDLVFEDLVALQQAWQGARGRRQEARGRRQEAGGKKQEARSKKQEARSKRQEARGKKQEARSKKQEAGSKKQESCILHPASCTLHPASCILHPANPKNRNPAMDNAPDDQLASSRGSVTRAAGIIALGNVLSRVLGLVRDVTVTHFFSASMRSAFDLAWQIPQWIYDLLVGGHISAALVPVLSEYTEPERRAELWRIASMFFSLVAAALAVVVLVIEAAAPWIISLTGGGFPGELQQTATRLLRLSTPALLFLGLTGAVTGLLYALKRFTYPAFATAIFNAGIVVAILLGQKHVGIASAALGVLLGAVLQLALQMPGLRDARLRPALALKHPALRRILLLYLPVLFGVTVGIVGAGIDRRLASGTGAGSIAWMRNATTLIQTALGLIAVAVSVAILPTLSRAAAEKDESTYRNTLGLGLRLILTLVVPATAGLYALGRPLITLLFEHGEFLPYETSIVTWALYLYLIGLPFAAVDQLLIFAFYARQDTLRPNLVGAYAIGIYLLFALPFVQKWGLFALVIANSAQWTWHTLLMLLLLQRHVGWPHGQRVGATLLRALAAAGLMGLAAWGTVKLVGNMLGEAGRWGQLAAIGAGMAVALGVYLGLAVLLRLEEVRVAWEALRSHLGRS